MSLLDTLKLSTATIENLRITPQEVATLLPSEIIQDTASVINEYGSFICALIECRKIAEKEYNFVESELQNTLSQKSKIEEINQKVSSIKNIDEGSVGEQHQRAYQQLILLSETFTDSFNKSLDVLTEKVQSLTENLKYFKVILYGPTKAGKSTVREALTKGNGETIGKGGQSTTIEIHDYEWYNLKLYDTPGILSAQDTVEAGEKIGDEERKANKILEQADVAMFMFPTDNIHIEALQKLKETVSSGRDILVLLNVKEDMMNYTMFRKRNTINKISLDAQRGHVNRIMQEIPEYKDRVKIIPIHAYAGFLSRGQNNPVVSEFFEKFNPSKRELNQISHFKDIRNYLVENIIQHGRVIRCTTLRKCFIENITILATKNKKEIDNSIGTLEDVQKIINKTKKKIEKKFEKFKEGLLDDILNQCKDKINTFDFATNAIEYKKSKDDISSDWEIEVEKLRDIPQHIVESLIKDLQEDFSEMENQIQFAVDSNAIFNSEGGADWKTVFKYGTSLLAIASGVAFFFSGPVGWILGGLALLGSFLIGLFKSKERKIKELREKLDTELNSICEKMRDQIDESCDEKLMPELLTIINDAISSNNEMKMLAMEFGSVNKMLFEQKDKNVELFNQRIKELERA